MTIGERIRIERKKLGLSQEELGEKLNVSRQAVSKWEQELSIPDLDRLVGLSKVFDLSTDQLLGLDPREEAGEKIYIREETGLDRLLDFCERHWNKLGLILASWGLIVFSTGVGLGLRKKREIVELGEMGFDLSGLDLNSKSSFFSFIWHSLGRYAFIVGFMALFIGLGLYFIVEKKRARKD